MVIGSQKTQETKETFWPFWSYDPLIKQKMGHSNAKYTSNHIQNEILEVLADMVRKDVIEEVKESGVFSILADETKDLKNRNKFH